METRVKKYKISLYGCDDSTHFEMNLYPHEVSLIEVLSERSMDVSTYACMPRLGIKLSKEEEKEN